MADDTATDGAAAATREATADGADGGDPDAGTPDDGDEFATDDIPEGTADPEAIAG